MLLKMCLLFPNDAKWVPQNLVNIGPGMACYMNQCWLLVTFKTHWGRDKMAAIFADDIFKCIFLNDNVWIPIKVSLKFVP